MTTEATGGRGRAAAWFDAVVLDLARQMRWSFLPPLMVYFAAGVAGLTSVVGAFFVKDYLSLSASFLAGLTFWAGLPWVLKMPIGHVVDLIWRRKAALVFLGAGLIAASLVVMYLLVTERDAMAAVLPVETWYVTAALLAPTGYVIQDAVADAMTVEAVPTHHPDGTPVDEDESKRAHTTMQTLGRFAIISGLVGVAALNIGLFSGVETMSTGEKAATYGRVYAIALVIPLLSVSGVAVAAVIARRRAAALRASGVAEDEVDAIVYAPRERAEPDPMIFLGGGAFVAVTLGLGLSDLPWSAEIVFAATLAVVVALIARLTRALPAEQARALVGTAVIIFVFRAVPLPGPGLTWFEIDVLGFDERFLSILSLVTAGLTLAGLVLLRPMMASWPIPRIVALLALAGGVLSLPNIGLYYGVHTWTAAQTGGVVDARFIAILDTAIESPLGQVAMIPMLAWIARNAPRELKATFFAVMASFTNLALSASSLTTKHLNRVFVVTRETAQTPADYAELGTLLVTVAVIGVAAPLLAILAVQASRFRTDQ